MVPSGQKTKKKEKQQKDHKDKTKKKRKNSKKRNKNKTKEEREGEFVIPAGGITALPEEVLLAIFQHFDLVTLCLSSSVCKHWYNLLSDQTLAKV